MSSVTAMIHVYRGHQLPDGFPSPDVYFLPGYGQAAAVADEGEWVLIEAFDGAWQMPLIVQTLADGTKDAMSPYGYSGIYASPSLNSLQVQQAWFATVDFLGKEAIISVLLRHSPLVPQAYDLPGLISIVSGHPTIVLEPADGDSAWSNMESRCRNQTRKALKNGYTGDVRAVAAQDLAPDSDFRRLYEQTMKRRDATPPFFFEDGYYRELLAGLGANLFIAEVRDPAGDAASSTLLMRHGKLLHYHLTGSNISDARMGSNNLMLWTATQFAVTHGMSQFHLGGGLEARDDLFRFKSKFGGRELEYRVSGLVVDEKLYREHVRNRAKAFDVTTDTLLASNHFPAYRGGTPVSGEPQDSEATDAKRAPDAAPSPIVHINSAWLNDQVRCEQNWLSTALESRR
jgi:serine/alanine adding enzyme